MPNEIDIKKLEKKVSSISDALAKLNSAADFRKLILEWRRPGWTTPAELIFASAILDAMADEIGAAGRLKTNLMRGSKAVTGR